MEGAIGIHREVGAGLDRPDRRRGGGAEHERLDLISSGPVGRAAALHQQQVGGLGQGAAGGAALGGGGHGDQCRRGGSGTRDQGGRGLSRRRSSAITTTPSPAVALMQRRQGLHGADTAGRGWFRGAAVLQLGLAQEDHPLRPAAAAALGRQLGQHSRIGSGHRRQGSAAELLPAPSQECAGWGSAGGWDQSRASPSSRAARSAASLMPRPWRRCCAGSADALAWASSAMACSTSSALVWLPSSSTP